MEYIYNFYRTRKLGNNYFVSTDSGCNILLSEHDMQQLKDRQPSEELKLKLIEKEILIFKDDISKSINSVKNRNIFLFTGTSLHIIVLTLRCNMNCIYCHASSRSENEKKVDMNIETATKTVDFIFQSPSKNIRIELQGGEPTLNWQTAKHIIDYSIQKNKTANKNLGLTLVTNMTTMDNEKMDFLINNNVSVCTSLDGPKEIHDSNRLCVFESNYEQVKKWLLKFNDEYKKRGIDKKASALVTLTKKSLWHSKEIVDEYVKSDLEMIHLRFLNKIGVAKSAWEKIGYSSEDYLIFWKKAMERIYYQKKIGKKIDEMMEQVMITKLEKNIDPNYLDLRSPCGAAIGQLAYNYNGDIYPCDEARMIPEDLFLLGNVFLNNYSQIISCDKTCTVVNASINDQYICNYCAYKPYCGVCPVCSYSESGNIISNVTQTRRCNIFKEQFDFIVNERFIKNKKENK